MTKSKSTKFQGALKKPIRVGVLRSNDWPSELSQAERLSWEESANALVTQQHVNQCIEKFALLFDHYQIKDKTDFELLALHLAIDFVDGFKLIEFSTKLQHVRFGAVVPSNEIANGRPKEWTNKRLLDLFDDIQKIKIKENIKTDRYALMRLSTSKKWSRPNASDNLCKWKETLESRLQDAKSIAKQKSMAISRAESLIDMAQKIQLEPQVSDA